MRLAERHAPLHQPLGQVDGRGGGPVGRLAHGVGVEVRRSQHPRHRRQRRADLVDGVEQRLLVLLQVAVVRQGQALERGQHPRHVADQPARLAARQLGDVGVLLLGQHRAPRGIGVVEDHEAELLARPQHELLAQARQVHAQQGQVEQGLGHEVAIGHGVERVLEAAREAELLGDELGVERQRRARQRPGAQGAHVHAHHAEQQAVDVARQRPAVGEQVMGEQDGLGALQVRVPGEIGIRRLHGAVQQHALELEHGRRDGEQLAARVQAQVQSRPGHCDCGRCEAWPPRHRPTP